MPSFTRVADYMTAEPHWIGLRENLAFAAQRMRDLHVRHLPVLQDGILRGVVTERDVALVRSLELDPREVGVEEAMSVEPYTVSPSAPLGRAARVMAAHKYGCAVVMKRGKVVGILTATDAMRALAETLDEYEPHHEALSPGEVREIVLHEHLHIRQLLRIAHETAQRVASGEGDEYEVTAMRSAARSAYSALVAHTELEDRLLAPVLEHIDAWGPVRAESLRREHEQQRAGLERALAILDGTGSGMELVAASIEDMLAEVQRDMEAEEQDLIKSDLLTDSIVGKSVEDG
jgi:acetoin utilization protein AcuB